MQLFVVRGLVYLFGLAGVAQCIAFEALKFGVLAEYNEQSLTERLQDVFTFFSSMLFFMCAYLSKSLRQACILLGTLTLMMCVRESDSFLDHNVFNGAWQGLVSIILLVVVVGLRGQAKLTYRSLCRLSETSSFGFVVSGMVIILAFSRMIGRSDMWQALMGDAYMRVVKNVVEEGTELLGYTIVLIAAVELLVFALSARKKPVGTSNAAH